MNTILLRGGVLIDGSGKEPLAGDLLIEGERIAAIGKVGAPEGCRVIDCAGLTIAPGFIDAHSHSDLQVLEDRREKTAQGVATEVVGNCGFSAYPCGAYRQPLQEFANGIFRGSSDWGWANARFYLAEARRKSTLVNVVSLVGHGSLRVAHAGHRQGPLGEQELGAMESMLAEALEAGASGLSTGLMYAPGSSAPPEELLRLCRVVGRAGKVYATHMRSYSWHLIESVDEQLDLARRAECRLQISHLQAVGRANWKKQQQALENIETARRQGVDVRFDIYPYLAGSTVLTQLLPQRALEGGTQAMLERLGNPKQRREIETEMRSQTAQQWSDIFISAVGSEKNQPLVGKNIEQIAQGQSKAPIEAAMDLLAEEKGAVNIISFNQSEENLRRLITHPLSMVISDGFYVKGKPHPRLCGTFPRLLGELVREQRWLSLHEAIHKITGLPAAVFDMKQRGLLQPGYFADIAVFDPAKIAGPASYDAPETPPEGIRFVFREGRQTTPAPSGA